VHSRVYDHSLYLASAISETAEAYGELMSISVSSDGSTTTATFDDVEDIMYVDAFSNHALFLSIQEFRNGDDG
jgi:hypothetical protein